uniref:Uncharacterized protein n=1 Tax=Cucumis sativus TaxID=3659 RepID=A0A0A0LTR7_CUCSA
MFPSPIHCNQSISNKNITFESTFQGKTKLKAFSLFSNPERIVFHETISGSCKFSNTLKALSSSPDLQKPATGFQSKNQSELIGITIKTPLKIVLKKVKGLKCSSGQVIDQNAVERGWHLEEEFDETGCGHVETWESLFGFDMKGFEIQMAGKHEKGRKVDG